MQDRFWKTLMRRKMYLISLIVLVNFLVVSTAAEPTAVVKTTSGPVQGAILTTYLKGVKYAAFKGVRFAEPPVGYLRYKPPVPIRPWTETLNATTEGNICTQLDSRINRIVGSEDCLSINVYTPVTQLDQTPEQLKSVMVWIYGGAFVTGSGSTEMYRPDYLLEKDVVFVSFNYRLGPLGFLYLDHPNATGNAGLKDQNLALKWVRDNIKNFGGNPNNVTIFGESAGSVSVGFHVLADPSEGLFHGAISMSGTPINPWGFQKPAKALARARELGVLLGTLSPNKEELLKTFYTASASQLVNATATFGDVIPPFTPTLEDKSISPDAFLTECSLNKYKTGNFTTVPHILGYMDDETLYFTHSFQQLLDLVTNSLDLASEIGMQLPSILVIAKRLIESATYIAGGISKAVLDAIIAETTDLLFIAQIDQTQQILAKYEDKPIYYYHDSFYTDRNLHNILFNTTLLGAAHADDLGYIFYVPEANYSTDPTDPMARTIDRVTTMWTNFAKYGNPTPDWVADNNLGITWPNSGPSGRSLNIGTDLVVEPRPVNTNTEIIETLSWPLLPKLNGCL